MATAIVWTCGKAGGVGGSINRGIPGRVVVPPPALRGPFSVCMSRVRRIPGVDR